MGDEPGGAKASSQASFWQPKKSFNAITGEPRSCQKYIPKQVHRFKMLSVSTADIGKALG